MLIGLETLPKLQKFFSRKKHFFFSRERYISEARDLLYAMLGFLDF
jgi:hypothetical protein